MDGNFEFVQWASLAPAAGWQFAVGRFTGGDRDELVGYHPSNGTLWVGENAGSEFRFLQWATVVPAAGWQLYAGRITGGDVDDVVVYHPSNGVLSVGRNTGGGFAFEDWATVAPAAGWTFTVGHFHSGPTADIVGYHPTSGTVWVGTNTGASFEFEPWGTVSPPAGWAIVAADVTGNGRTDVVAYHPSNGSLWIGRNTGGGFEYEQWYTFSPIADWAVVSGHVLGRGQSDVIAYHPSDGSVWVLANRGDRFDPMHWATVTPAAGWTFLPGRFTDDELTDVVGYHSGTGGLWVGRFRMVGIEGYCWPLSAAPGEQIDFHLSSEGTVDVVYARHVADATGVRSVPVGTGTCEPGVQSTAAASWRDGCGWAPSMNLTVPEGWRSGIYSARCVNSHGQETHVTFVVKPAPERRSDLAVLANVNTWLAYNGWGGYSKYTGRATVSFLRPCPASSPVGWGFEALHLTRAELWILGWLTGDGYRPDVCSDIDFHNGIDLSTYRCLVIGTHPEYWTTTMYDRLQGYLDGGGSLLYLGGNGIFENGEYTDDQTQMVFWAGIDRTGKRTDAMFRRLTPPRPERSLLGVTTERCGAVGSPYEVVEPDHSMFRWAGLTAGKRFGDAGLNTGAGNGKASGWEVDTVDGPGALTVPVDCQIDPSPSPDSPLPDGWHVIARAVPEERGRSAEMVFYRHPGGGLVLSAGSLTFGGSLPVDPAIQQILRNALTEAGVV